MEKIGQKKQKICREYNLKIVEIEKWKKSKWKKEMKKKIQEFIDQQWKVKAGEMKKLRHINDGEYGRKQYLRESTTEETARYMRARLEMWGIIK